MTKEARITFDCADLAGLAASWVEVLCYQLQAPPDGFDSWDAALKAFGVWRGSGTRGRRSSRSRAEASRVELLGAARAHRVEPEEAAMEVNFIIP